LKKFILKLLVPFSDATFAKVVFFLRQKRFLKLKHPQTFNEKLTHIKLNSDNKLRRKVADRLTVRRYVKERCPEIGLINLLWSGKEFAEETYDCLPREFVIKGNHGSRMVKVVDKTETDYPELYQEVGGWMSLDYASKGRERVYQNLDRYYVVEERLPSEGLSPPDFKFFCFDGKVEMVQVDFDRFSGHRRNLYDRKFELLPVRLHLKNGPMIEKPRSFEKAIKYAECLSRAFSFIRVDLYLIEDEVYFGELTNFPGNGLETFYPRSYDLYLGNKLTRLT